MNLAHYARIWLTSARYSIVLTLMFGKFSGLTGGNDYTGFDFGDGDGGSVD